MSSLGSTGIMSLSATRDLQALLFMPQDPWRGTTPFGSTIRHAIQFVARVYWLLSKSRSTPLVSLIV
jgi:hypothetical protein